MNAVLILNTLVAVLLFFFLSIFAIDFTIPFPRQVVVQFQQPVVKMACYILVYLVAYWNPVVSLLALMAVILVHVNEVMILRQITTPNKI